MNLIRNFAEIFFSFGKICLFSFLLLFYFLIIPLDAEIFKWTDENGKMHFTDSANKIPKKYRQKNINQYNSKQYQFICDTEQYPESENQLNVIQEKIREIQKKINEEKNKERRILKRRQNVKTKIAPAGSAGRPVNTRKRLGRLADIKKMEQDRLSSYDQGAQAGGGQSSKSGIQSANEPGKRKKSADTEAIKRLKKAKEKLEANLDTAYNKYNCDKFEISN